ncbi:MAG: hypothetical protein IJH76_03455 [Clostridia bacterium]|nr:hypothetical protein [Clostridia bacterium]
MLYPQKINAKKTDFIIRVAILISYIFGLLLVLINRIATPGIRWAGYCNAGIVYIWITVLYLLRRNVNIASHLFIQMLAISALCVYFDIRMGFQAWSINFAIPLIVIVTNITMLILSIARFRNYARYAFFQVLIVLLSLIPIFLVYENMVNDKSFSIFASCLSLFNLIISLIFHFKDMKTELARQFHL